MPKYANDPTDYILSDEDVKAMFNIAKNDEEKAWISILWMTGARPQEILMLTTDRVTITEDEISFNMPTLKLGGAADFKVKDRELTIPRESADKDMREGSNFVYQETIVRFVSSRVPRSHLFTRTTRWGQKVLNRLGEKATKVKVTPYHFRHSFFVWFARRGATLDELMNWKGALSVQSVSPYLRAKPQKMDKEKMERSRSHPKSDKNKSGDEG